MVIAAAAAPIPIPALAPAERPAEDEETAAALCAAVVALVVKLAVAEARLWTEVVVGSAVVEDIELDVGVDVPPSVETIAPRPLRTMPRSLAQQAGSLSRQKLPSSHSTARGRKPVPGSVTHHHHTLLRSGHQHHRPY